MRHALLIAVLLGLGVVQGCATMSEAECHSVDWRVRGEDDARQGMPSSTVSRHAEACASYSVSPDTAAYRSGWDEGIKVYCTRSNGWRRGLEGDYYEDSCPIELEADFLAAYRLGAEIHEHQSSVDQLEYELVEVNAELDDLDADQTDKKAKLKKKRKRLKKDLASATALLVISRLEAQTQGFDPP